MSDPLFPRSGGTGGAPRGMGLFGRILAALATLAALVVGFMASVFVFAIALVVGILVWAWLWWRMRRVMKQMRQDPRFSQTFGTGNAGSDAFTKGATGGNAAQGDVIEGEVIRGEWKDGKDPR